MSVAVIPGSFDPFTNGHLYLVGEAMKAFDYVIVLIAVNPSKEYMFSVDERRLFIENAVSCIGEGVRVDFTDGLVVDYAVKRGATIVRGLRGASDVSDEMHLASQYRGMDYRVSVMLCPTRSDLGHVSSSHLKKMARSGWDMSKYCSGVVWSALNERVGKHDKDR